MKRIFQIIKSNKVLAKNFTSLSLLQISNYLFPLITLPYLVRVLGPEKYGLINFAAAFSAYFTILTDYGFNLSATQEISVNRDDDKKVSEIFSNVLSAKLILFLVSTFIFFICLISFNIFKENIELYILSYSGILGSVIFPLWYFQGKEKMSYIFKFNFIVKLISTITIFTLINQSNDYLLLIIIYAFSQITYGIMGLIYALKKDRITFSKTNLREIAIQIKKGSNYFISSFGINAVMNSNIFILGLFAPANVVGYFAAADKIRLAFQSLFGPIFTTTFSHVSNLAQKSNEQFYKFSKKTLVTVLTVGISIFVVSYCGAEKIVNILLGPHYTFSISILKILSIVPLLYAASNFLGVQILLPLNKSKNYAKVMIVTIILHTLLSLILSKTFLSIGTSYAIIITELFTITFLIITISRLKLMKNVET